MIPHLRKCRAVTLVKFILAKRTHLKVSLNTPARWRSTKITNSSSAAQVIKVRCDTDAHCLLPVAFEMLFHVKPICGNLRNLRLFFSAFQPETANNISRYFKSVTNMCPGSWVIASDGLARMIASIGVTPQAQNTGTSPGRIVTASP